jgi:hypothetical protein
MGETIKLEPGTRWENPWSKEKVEVLDLEGGRVRVKILSTGETKEFADTTHFMKIHVSAE